MGYSRHQFIQMHIQKESRTRQVIRVVPWEWLYQHVLRGNFPESFPGLQVLVAKTLLDCYD